MPIIYLALGTNLGKRASNLRRAIQALPPVVTVQAESPVYETSPWGLTDQPLFLNMVLKGETRLAPLELLQVLKQIESKLGRVPSARYGPRLIDIDILFYDELILNTPELTLPHPRLHERAFVLVPLNDLAPALVHPVLGKPVSALLD
ncbi:MAG: 2-amino-4-hydroxy-6-hydroxymethyldihydropteridine diphosphokinase [Chloroflexi bacterium]|nr:2-amino-4-hydroxy-6-hydroxymethyldihydropteridine diphosphokinase [Chloroflexota bacterium]